MTSSADPASTPVDPGIRDLLVVFDCFGTLVQPLRPMPSIDNAVQKAKTRLKLSEDAFDAFMQSIYITLANVDRIVQPATHAVLARACAAAGIEHDQPEMDALLWEIDEADSRYQLMPGAHEGISEIASWPKTTLRILSNSLLPGELMWRLLDGLGLPPVFDHAVFTGDGGPRKPACEAFDRVGAGSFTVRAMVGDSERHDLRPARELGWLALHFESDPPDFDRLVEELRATTSTEHDNKPDSSAAGVARG